MFGSRNEEVSVTTGRAQDIQALREANIALTKRFKRMVDMLKSHMRATAAMFGCIWTPLDKLG